MSKFKKGDRVRNLRDTGFLKAGDLGTVDENNSITPYVNWDGKPFGALGYAQTECDMELVANPSTESIYIYTRKNRVVATITKGEQKFTQSVALSKANGDFKTAVKMVVERLMDKWKVENKTDGNFKAKCIRTGGDSGLIKGKIYEFIDGYGKWNNGTKMPQFENCGISRFGSFSDLLKWFSDDETYKWEEVKEGTPLTADGFRIVKQDKYEVGDTVKVRENLKVNKPYGGNAFIRDMTPWLGEMVKLENKFTDGFSIEGDTNPLKYHWTPEMFEGKVIETAVKTASNVSLEINGKPVLSCDCDNDGNLETSFDWSGFKQGKFAVHCDTEEKARAFLKECDAQGIKWGNGKKPNEDFAWSPEYPYYHHNSCLFHDDADYCKNDIKIAIIDYTPSKPAVKEVKRHASKGEYIKIVDAVLPNGYKNGDILKVTDIDTRDDDGDVWVVPDERAYVYGSEYVVLENYIPEDKPTYTEVHRPAKAGEWIKILPQSCGTISDYKGQIFHDFDVDNEIGIHVNLPNGKTVPVLTHEYVVLENYQPEEPKTAVKEEPKVDTAPKPFVKAKVGDKIKVVKVVNFHTPRVAVGDIQTVDEVSKIDVGTTAGNLFADTDAEYIILNSTSDKSSNKPMSVCTDEELITELFNRQPK